jgi:hypothetical protein
VRPPPSLRKPAPFRRQAERPLLRPFLAISSSHFSVSVEKCGSLGRFPRARLRWQKSRSWRRIGRQTQEWGALGRPVFLGAKSAHGGMERRYAPNCENIWQHLPCQDGEMTKPLGPSCRNVVLCADDQCLGTRNADKYRNGGNADCDHRILEAGAEERGQCNRERKPRRRSSSSVGR